MEPIPSCAEVSNATQQRRHQACERCWKRKQKCDKILPSCSSCAAMNVACKSRHVDLTELPEDAILSHASVLDYVGTLKRNADHLESVDLGVKRFRPGVRHIPSKDHRTLSSSTDTAFADVDENGDPSVRAAMGEIRNLSRSAMAEPRGETPNYAQDYLNLENMTVSVIALDGSDPSRCSSSQMGLSELLMNQTQRPALKQQPTKPLIECFVSEYCSLFPHLHPKELWSQYESVIVDSESLEHRDLSGDTSVRDFNVYMGIAIGAILSPSPGRLEHLTHILHDHAVRMLKTIFKQGDSMAVIHVLLILVLYSTLNPEGGSTWHLIDLAMKQSISLGLHREPDAHTYLDGPRLELRQRLFWSLYILDRTMSSIMDRPFGIQDEDITINLPNPVERLGADDSLSNYHILQSRLISHIRSDTEQPTSYHYANFCYWRDIRVEVMEDAETTAQVKDYLLQLSCRTLVLIVHNLLFSPIPELTAMNSALRAIQDTRTECKRFLEVMYEKMDRGRFISSVASGYDIFSAGVTFIIASYDYSTFGSALDAEISEVGNKCSNLITACERNFIAVKDFRRTLSALQSFALNERRQSVPILSNPPPIVPNYIRNMIERFVAATTQPNASATQLHSSGIRTHHSITS